MPIFTVNCHFFDEAKNQLEEVMNYSSYFTPFSIFSHYNSEGRMYYLKQDYPKAREAFSEAFHVAQSLDNYSQTIIMMNLAEVSLCMNNLDSAQFYFNLLDSKQEIINNSPLFEFNYYSLLGEYNNKKRTIQRLKNYSIRPILLPVLLISTKYYSNYICYVKRDFMMQLENINRLLINYRHSIN